jgi:hypothetical protein
VHHCNHIEHYIRRVHNTRGAALDGSRALPGQVFARGAVDGGLTNT